MLSIALAAAREAGAYLRERFSGQLVPDEETHNDVKLPEDKESERRIIEIIHSRFPDHTVYAEEIGVVERDEEYVWIVDPLDGTNNYYVGHPYFSVSIALQHAGDIVLGVVYNPVAEQLFWAEKGKGAYVNGRKLAVSDRTELTRAVGTYIRGRDSMTKEDEWAATAALFFGTKRLMRNFAPALDWCLLAGGRIDYVVMQRSDIMDVAAGILIAREAGAVVTDWEGEPYRHQPYDKGRLTSLIATNGRLHEDIRRLAKEAHPWVGTASSR